MAGTDVIGGGNIEPRALEDEMRSAYLDYAMSVIVGRALPDVRDGLKPVHRRVLFSMNENGLRPDRARTPSAPRIVGDVMGKYHPHGDSAIYDTLVRMAQDFSHALPARRRPGQLRLDRRRPRRGHALHRGAPDAPGDGDAARPRQGHGRLRRPTTTARSQEPLVLPARFPNLLVNGSTGIAVGMATNIPPHNLREIDRRRRSPSSTTRQITVEGLMAARQGPGLPDRRDHPRAPRASATPTRPAAAACACAPARTSRRSARARRRSIVTELPYVVKKGGDGGLITKIADLVHEKKLPEITDLRDESDRNGMRLVIELKRDALPKVVLNQLYKHTAMQTTFGVNMVALVDGVPRTLSLREVICAYVNHQREVIVRRTKYELRREGAPRAHPRGPADRARQPRRGHRADPRLARPRQRPHRADGALRALADPGARRSSTCACRSSPRWSPTRSRAEHADVDRAHRGAARRSSATRRASWASSRRSSARSPSASATTGARRSRPPRTRSTSRT